MDGNNAIWVQMKCACSPQRRLLQRLGNNDECLSERSCPFSGDESLRGMSRRQRRSGALLGAQPSALRAEMCSWPDASSAGR